MATTIIDHINNLQAEVEALSSTAAQQAAPSNVRLYEAYNSRPLLICGYGGTVPEMLRALADKLDAMRGVYPHSHPHVYGIHLAFNGEGEQDSLTAAVDLG